MNKKLTIASALLAASAAFAGLDDGVFELWLGSEGAFQVLTGIGNESETAGYWFSYDDSGDKGGSKVIWADGTVDLGNGDSPDALDNVILWCNGVCGSAVLDKGELSYNPFVGIGFNVVGEISKGGGNPQPGDASAWGGVCITYAKLRFFQLTCVFPYFFIIITNGNGQTLCSLLPFYVYLFSF